MAKPIDVKLGEEISEKYNLDVVVVLGIDGKEDRVYTIAKLKGRYGIAQV